MGKKQKIGPLNDQCSHLCIEQQEISWEAFPSIFIEEKVEEAKELSERSTDILDLIQIT